MDLQANVRAAFTAGGVLERATEAFANRSGQRDMALAVAQTIEDGGTLVVEAGTGIGKTFAYLVPALLSGERVMVSTATKALQDQLFSRDLPRLVKALGLPVKAALLKGRSSYLCLHRLGLARHETGGDRISARTLAKIEAWSQATFTGDLAELPGLDERSPIIPLVTSTRDNCLGSQCPKFKACHVSLARREALAADVVVVNHHLFFADLAVRESGMAELLPTVRVAIFDEAHQLNETGVQFLGRNISTGKLLDFCRDLLGTGLTLARGLVDWQALVGGVEHATRELRLIVGKQPPNARVRWLEAAPDGLDADAWVKTLDDLQNALQQACEGLATVSELAPDFVRLHERASMLGDTLKALAEPCTNGSVRWLDVSVQLRLVESPLDIAQTMRQRLLGQGTGTHGQPAQTDGYGEPMPEPSSKSWIFTSATLGDDEALSWFTQPCGLEAARVLVASSPFDYPTQAAVYVPRHLPRPNDPAHSAAVADVAAQAVQRLGGRTMVLTTTLRALRAIGERLTDRLAGSSVSVLVQGALPKRELVERFRSATTEHGCVLVASASFWEGIDVPGEALQVVIIDKLPFPPPNDPLVEARAKRLESEGRSAFNDYFVPEAAVSLKQGAGRLIRRESDHGILVLCDTRLVQMGYGKRLLNALPPMRRLHTTQEFEAALEGLR